MSMASTPTKHICFYSNNCKWSKIFITELSKTPQIVSQFNFICVDPSPKRPALPIWLKKVPTLVVSGENQPRVAEECMNWLYEQKVKKETTTGSGEPDAFNMSEMANSYEDSYCFLDVDMSSQGNGGSRICHSFEFIDGTTHTKEGVPIYSTQSNKKISKKEELFDMQLEQFKKERGTIGNFVARS